MISKIKTEEILSICIARHGTQMNNCRNCQYYGAECLEAHTLAIYAVKHLKLKEVNDGK